MMDYLYNDDSHGLAGAMTHEQVIDERVDNVAALGVTTFAQCVNSMKVNYPSRVWDSYTDGFDPDGPDDQPLFAHCDPAMVKQYRSFAENLARLAARGIDYPGRALARCRKKGMAPWVSVRMNDFHHTVEGFNHPSQNSFWRSNPEFRRRPNYFEDREWQALDYGRPQVREHYRSLIEEVLERYDVDGLEMDFMRSPFLFKVGREREGGDILTGWLRDQVRPLATKAAETWGHPVQLSVRVPTRPMTALRLGLDVVAWAREGLIEVVVLESSPYSGLVDCDMPIRLWRDLIKPHGVKLIGAVLPAPSDFRYPGATTDRFAGLASSAADVIVGIVVCMLHEGADGVQLYNFGPEGVAHCGRGWTAESVDRTLKALRSLESLLPLRRRHIVTCSHITAPGELIAHNPLIRRGGSWMATFDSGQYPLPAEGNRLAFRLQSGPRPSGRNVQVVIGMEAGLPGANHISDTGPMLMVNDVSCKPHPVKPGDVLFTFDVPEQAMADGEHVIEVIAEGWAAAGSAHALRVTRVELLIDEERVKDD